MTIPVDLVPLLTDLASTRDELLPWYGPAGEPFRDRTYRPGSWTAHQLLVHLADTETVLLDRVRRLAADDKPLLWAFDQNAWADRLGYAQRDLATAGRLFAVARETMLELAVGFSSTTLAHAGVHTERGKVTLADTLAGIARHTRHHLGQLTALAQGDTWSSTAAVHYR